MRALLTPVVIKEFGIVAFRPGPELIPHFHRGRILLENEPERLAGLPTGEIPVARQPLAEDPAMVPVFEHADVIRRAGGLSCLEGWLLRESGCQYRHTDYHHHEMVTMRHVPGVLRLCWACDIRVREQFTNELAGIARENLVAWLLSVVRAGLGFDDSHVVTLPELCWWLTLNKLAHAIPEAVARKVLRIPAEKVQSVTREADIVPSLPPTSIVEEAVKKVLALQVDPETPESFMLRPKRRRWQNEKYTRWVKAQQCACCQNPADDPHHLIGHGMGGMGTKAHDLFVIPLCRAHHDELHADAVAFEAKYGTQPELLLKTLDRALAIGALA
ncbi:DUF968 domain-containing protein [Leclercia adecarboxylata]|uniref:DUF968 domain-containing protein n=1 Tax=Leclercia adecarboxylata TaxID=83655 RepID=UPI002DB8C5B1|nr:DUF968 domain-containing protein [Leclercia adecarboxylata]MEB6380075.1 DUF968 domain-containing protein [Leclercia adecarboxylata]